MSDLHSPVLEWYDEHARDLPWRRTDASAWSVMVSEFMLQQTPVARVLPVHEAWLAQWPTPAALAAAETGEAVRAWGRLGYPRRALRLHAAATAIVGRPRRRGAGGRTTTCWRCRASATTPRRRSRRSRTAGATSCSTPTSAGCFARAVSGVEFPAAAVTRAERDLAAGAAARRRADRGDLGGRGDGARRAGVHRRRTRPARAARSPTGAPGARPATRRTTGRPARCRRTPAPTGSAAAGCSAWSATATAPSRSTGWTRPGRTRSSASGPGQPPRRRPAGPDRGRRPGRAALRPALTTRTTLSRHKMCRLSGKTAADPAQDVPGRRAGANGQSSVPDLVMSVGPGSSPSAGA